MKLILFKKCLSSNKSECLSDVLFYKMNVSPKLYIFFHITIINKLIENYEKKMVPHILNNLQIHSSFLFCKFLHITC